MRRLGVVVLFVLLVAAAAFVALWPGCDGPTAPAPVPAAPPVASTQRRTGPGGEIPADSRAPREPAKKRTTPAPGDVREETVRPVGVSVATLALVVHVTGEAGEDVPGARVLTRRRFREPTKSQLLASLKSVQLAELTDARGLVRFEPYGRNLALVLATKDDLAGLSRLDEVNALALPESGTIEKRVEVRLAASRRLRGVVLGRGEVPVAGAEIDYAWASQKPNMIDVDWETRTAEDGTFELPPLPQLPGGSEGYLTAIARGYQPFQQDIHAADDTSEPLRIQLLPGITVKGRCVDERGKPVVHAAVHWIGLLSTVPTDAEGRFVLEGVPNHGVDLWVTHPEFASGYVRHVKSDRGLDAEMDVGDVVLVKGGAIRGVFVDLENKPLAGSSARLERADGGEMVGHVVTDDEGRFAFEHVAPVPHTLVVTEAGEDKAWSARREAVARGVVPDAGEVRVVLTGALGVHVRFLREPDRTPVRVDDVKLEAVGAGATDGSFGFSWSGDAAEIDGVRFEVRHAGAYRVEITIPGFAPAVVEKLDVLPDRETRIDVLFREPPK